jgi:serine/threonine-protein kinase
VRDRCFIGVKNWLSASRALRYHLRLRYFEGSESAQMANDDIQLVYPIGTVLRSKYRLDRVLGVGGMAVVYAATHRNQKRFAVKMLHQELSMRQDIRDRFLREGYAANTVAHAGAVSVLDDDVTEEGAAFLVMELLEGESVEQLSERSGRRLSVGAVLAIGHQVADVLAAAHSKSIVHRDIKPANLFITREGQLKVLDFGIARLRDVAATIAQSTGTGVVLGTPAFMSPEQALGRSHEIDASTDLWAVGATLYTLLAGRNVHEGENGQQILIRAATTPAASLASADPYAPRAVVDIVDRALAFEKRNRWPDAVAMRDAIRDAYTSVCGRSLSRDSLVPLVGEGTPLLTTDPSGGAFNLSPGRTPPFDFRAGVPAVAPPADGPTNDPEFPAPGERGRPMSTPSRAHAKLEESGAVVAGPPLPISGPTTTRPVLSNDLEFSGSAGLPKRGPRVIAIAGAGLASIALAAFGIWAVMASGLNEARPRSRANGAAPSESPAVQSTASADSSPSSPPPVVAPVVTSAPSSLPIHSTASAAVVSKPPDVTRLSRPAAPAQCNPPYTLDPITRKKTWKPDCL